MQEILLALAIASGATMTPPPSKIDKEISAMQEYRYLEGLRNSLKSFQGDSARFTAMVNGTFVPKSPQELKRMEETLHSLQQGDRSLKSLIAPPELSEDHGRLVKGCDQLLQGASLFFNLYQKGTQPKKAQETLSYASALFTEGYRELSMANASIATAWRKNNREKASTHPKQ